MGWFDMLIQGNKKGPSSEEPSSGQALSAASRQSSGSPVNENSTVTKATKIQKISSEAKSVTATHKSPKRTPSRAARSTSNFNSLVPPADDDEEEIFVPPPSLNREGIPSLNVQAGTENEKVQDAHLLLSL